MSLSYREGAALRQLAQSSEEIATALRALVALLTEQTKIGGALDGRRYPEGTAVERALLRQQREGR